MVQHCVVPFCTNNTKNKGISFFSFPRDNKLRKTWLIRMRRDEKKNVSLSDCMRVCSAHFLDADIIYSKNGKRRYLRKDAVPSVFAFTSPRKLRDRRLLIRNAVDALSNDTTLSSFSVEVLNEKATVKKAEPLDMMNSNDDSFQSGDSDSDHDSDSSSECSSQQMSSNKILILSAESLASSEGTKYVFPRELDLGSSNITDKSDLNESAANVKNEKGNPVIIKAQPIVSSTGATQYILLPEPTSVPTNEKQKNLQIQNASYNSSEERRAEVRKKERIREKNVSYVEKSTLLQICQKYPVLDDKTCNNESNNRKKKAWEDIRKEFIATCTEPYAKVRSIKFLQGCWSRFQKESRKAKRRAQNEVEKEAVSSPVTNKYFAPSSTGTESHPAHRSECLNEEGTLLSEKVSDSLKKGEKAITSEPSLPLTNTSNSGICSNDLPVKETVTSNFPSLLLNRMPCPGDSQGQIILTSNPLLISGSNSSLNIGNSALNGLKTGDSKASASDVFPEQPTKTVASNFPPILLTGYSNSVPYFSDSLPNGQIILTSNSHPFLVGDSNKLLGSGEPVGNEGATAKSKGSLSDLTAGPLQMNQPAKLCLTSENKAKTMSIKAFRRKALELALEVEKERLTAARYQKEAEQERLAAMKLQKSVQEYALKAEKEKYETELLKKEAARLALEKEKIS